MDQVYITLLESHELNAINLMDVLVYNEDDEKIGSISHVYGDGLDIEMIVDIGGTLLIGPKPVSLKANQVEFGREEGGLIRVILLLSHDELGLLLDDVPPDRR